MNGIPSPIDQLSRILNTAGLRHRVIAQNVANVNTPGYRRCEVAFEHELNGALGAGTSSPRPSVVESSESVVRADGNNVSLEQEMGELNKNSLLYSTAAQLLSTRLGMFRSAISGR